MRKVLITGSTGFLGTHLVATLQSKGVEIVALNSKNCDLTQSNALANKVANADTFDHIFHLAAWTQAGTFCDTHRGIQWIVNQQINSNVLAWWQQYAPQAKMICLGTSISYTTENDLEESKYMIGEPYDKYYAYAHCKRMLLVGLECLNKQYGMDYLYLVPSTLYGPQYHTDNRQLHFIYDLIRKISRGKRYNETVTLWGDGYQRRELVYVDDFIEVLLLLNQKCKNELYNIGSGSDYSIRDFATIICEKIGYDFQKIQFDTNQFVGAQSKILNVEKYKQILEPLKLVNTPLNIGLQNTIDWMNENEQIFFAQ